MLVVFKRRCWSKSCTQQALICPVCYCSRTAQHYSSRYCCTEISNHIKRHICDVCVHQHVLSRLYSCLTNSVTCPETTCRAFFSPDVVCHILLQYGSHALLDDYLREQQWQGKSEEWIKRFASTCPGCQAPIEKNGGCDEMRCIRCQTHFYWSKARRYGDKVQKIVSTEVNSSMICMYRMFLMFACLVIMFFIVCQNRK